ncbi:MAG: hypothetical protein IPI49_08085 [Myxococcales bacterium]|nr:hypothetical protein [Myxococcales bacterium]
MPPTTPPGPTAQALADPQGGGAAGAGDGQSSDPVTDLKSRLAEKPGMVGQEFRAGAVREGVEQFGELVKKVDFPAFVSGLVNGVFRAVVDASIDQMKAYAELLAACSKTVDEFARDNITEGAARDAVRNRFPGSVTLDTSGENARLRLSEGATGDDLTAAYQLDLLDLDSDEGEAVLLAAAKLQLARERQQLMATMVLLGINRIVVTNGQINAKVVFDMRADDSAKRRAEAELHDEQKSASSAGAAAVAWSPWGAGGGYAHSSQSHVATVSSAVDDTSEARAEVKAQLSGDVQLKFKSETFPLERMVSAGGLALLNARATPATPPGAAPAAATTTAAPAPQPTGAPR